MSYRLVALLAAALLGPPVPAGKVEGAYTTDGRLQVPQQYREWIFLSAGLDMDYRQEVGTSDHSMFDNVFVDRVAYDTFIKTGTWPDGTLLVKEDRGGTEKGSINRHGKSQTSELMGLEVHVKDTQRFAGGWAFFFFPSVRSEPVPQIPTAADCYTCHRQHGAVDSTFVQFYPTLLSIATQKKTLSPDYRP